MNLSQYCLLPLAYFGYKRYRLITEGEKYFFFIPQAIPETPILLKDRVYKKADYQLRTTIKMATLLIPGILAGSILYGISFLSSKVERITPPTCLYLQEIVKKSMDHSLVYHEVTRRVKNLDQLEEKIRGLSDLENNIQNLVQAMEKKDWQASIFKNEDYPFYLLAALKNGKVTAQQFGTVMFYWSANQYHQNNEIQAIPIFIDGQRNAIAEKYIIQTLTTTNFKDSQIQIFTFLNPQQIDDLFNSLKELPASEQQLFVVPDIQGIFKNSKERIESKNSTISQIIVYNTGINVFDRLFDDSTDSTLRMLPSVGLMQTFLNVMGGANAVKINPVLGLSSIQDIRLNGLQATRDMAFQFPGIALPKEADNYNAPHYDFPYHDLYHNILCSLLSDESRKKSIFFADAIDTYLKKNGLTENEGGQYYHFKFIDMEHAAFRQDVRQKITNAGEEILLWQTIYTYFSPRFQNETERAFDENHLDKLLTVVVKEALRLGMSLTTLEDLSNQIINRNQTTTNKELIMQKMLNIAKG
jgi:hypothetical protein